MAALVFTNILRKWRDVFRRIPSRAVNYFQKSSILGVFQDSEYTSEMFLPPAI